MEACKGEVTKRKREGVGEGKIGKMIFLGVFLVML